MQVQPSRRQKCVCWLVSLPRYSLRLRVAGFLQTPLRERGCSELRRQDQGIPGPASPLLSHRGPPPTPCLTLPSLSPQPEPCPPPPPQPHALTPPESVLCRGLVHTPRQCFPGLRSNEPLPCAEITFPHYSFAPPWDQMAVTPLREGN